MAVEDGQSISDLADYLQKDISRYSFFELVEKIKRASSEHERPILFSANPTLGFRNTDLDNLSYIGSSDENSIASVKLLVNFFGLHGANSPLPTFYTEDVLGLHEDESASRQFLDLFNHRLVELLHQVWSKYQVFKDVDAERGRSAKYLQQLAGLQGIPEDEARLLSRLQTLFGNNGMSGENLQRALTVLLRGSRVDIVSNRRQWVDLDEEASSQLGRRNTVLGGSALLGNAIESCENAFIIRIWVDEPINYSSLKERIGSWLRVFNLSYLDYEIEYYLGERVIEPGKLGGDKSAIGCISLGKSAENNYTKYLV